VSTLNTGCKQNMRERFKSSLRSNKETKPSVQTTSVQRSVRLPVAISASAVCRIYMKFGIGALSVLAVWLKPCMKEFDIQRTAHRDTFL
jgi:hypothetical protein